MKITDLKTLKEELYFKYDYIFIKEEYDKIVLDIIEDIKRSNIKDNIDIIFIEKINNKIYEYIKSLKSNKNKYLSLISNFIDNNFKLYNSYNDNLKEINKLISFLKLVDFSDDINLITKLINKNNIVNGLLTIIVKENIDTIKNGEIENIFKDKMLLSLIEVYCILNNIEIKEDYENDFVIDDNTRMYLKELNRNLLSAEEEKNLFIRYKNGDKLAKDIIIERNLKLVISIAKKYTNRGIEFQDLIQEGNIGLITAVDKFDLSFGNRFSTCATWWIRQAINRAIFNKVQIVRLPVHISEKYYNFKIIYEELRVVLGREPTSSELANKMQISNKAVKYLIMLRNGEFNSYSLNALVSEDGDTELGELVSDKSISLVEDFESKDLHQNILDLLDKCELTINEKKVIMLRYGIINNEPMTLETISNLIDLTRERVRQIEKAALKKLVNSPNISKFAIYMDKPDEIIANIQSIRDFYNSGGHKKNKKDKSKNTISVKKVKKKKKLKTIYEIFNEFTKDEVNKVIENLDTESKKILELRYGSNLDNPVTSPEWDKFYAKDFYDSIIPRMRSKLIKNGKVNNVKANEKDQNAIKNDVNQSKIVSKENLISINISLKDLLLSMSIKDIVIICLKLGSFNKLYTDTYLKKILFINDKDIETAINKLQNFKFIKPIEFDTLSAVNINIEDLPNFDNKHLINILSNLNIEEFIILTLFLGYVNGYYYKIIEISKLLQVDEKVVREILKSALIKYKEGINKLLNNKKMNLKLSLNK